MGDETAVKNPVAGRKSYRQKSSRKASKGKTSRDVSAAADKASSPEPAIECSVFMPGNELKAGDVAVIKGLTANEGFNGKFAKAVVFDPRSGAWTCLVDSDVVGGVFRKALLKPSNLSDVPEGRQAKAKKWAFVVRAGGRAPTPAAKKASRMATSRPRSTRYRPLGGLKPTEMSEEALQHRDETRARLMQPIKAHPPRPKAGRTQRGIDASASVAHLKDPFDDRAETHVPIAERTPFFVQTGRRRTHMSRGHVAALSENKKAGWTEDERILRPTSYRGSAKPVWDFQRYPEDPIEPEWHPWQLQEAWAPEPPKVAEKLVKLRSKLRGVSPDDPSIQPAGDPNGPDLYC